MADRLSADAAVPLEDLRWLDRAVGDARVVAIGESAHYNAEFFRLRHRVLRHLVERHGFTAYAMETGFAEATLVDDWVRGAGAPDRLGAVMAHGLTSLMGLWTPMGEHLEWMRRYNGTAARPVGFHGIDLGGSNASLLPGLDAVLAHLAEAETEAGFRPDPVLRETAAAVGAASPFSASAALAAYAGLPAERRDALTAGLADLRAHLVGRRLEHVRRTGADAYARALRTLEVTIALDSMIRAMARGDLGSVLRARGAAIADTVEWILRREDRVVLAAHNLHVRRCPVDLPGMPPAPSVGMHLADRLGAGYVVIGASAGTGQTLSTDPAGFAAGVLFTDLEPPRPGTLDALLAASHDDPSATDLRRLSPADAAAVRAVTAQGHGGLLSAVRALEAYDVLVHLPHVTAAEVDPAALASALEEVRAPFATWAAAGRTR